MYKSFERRPTATEEKLSQYSGKLRIELADSESEEEKSSRSGTSQSARGGYRSALSPVKPVRTPHNIPPRKFSNQFDEAKNEAMSG